jgi:DNA polymerase-3 subunit gamma/tau
MAAKSTKPSSSPSAAAPAAQQTAEQYLVVARRYRPQTFAELVGQPHVSSALTSAILQQRVGHAYLFSGARGTGKTSTARILAKCLNCQAGMSVQPCQSCDICLGITSGDDIDVLEIDGASNRRIEEIRQLRSAVNIRPSRARYKIYIIDEVHMLTKEAFNALLKTLEEPPDHVKFLFCTTELDKIPITIRSRCQLFEFVPVEESAIRDRLRQIADAEGVAVDDDALAMLARRAAGSLRDSQSLLEQLLALGRDQIRLADVHALLGTAGAEDLQTLLGLLTDRQGADAIACAQRAFAQGVDAGQLASQLLGLFRDCLAASVGCDDSLLLNTPPDQCAALRASAQQLGPDTSLAIAQILDEALVKMRASSHPQVVLEVALVRICRLEHLQGLSDLIEQMQRSESAQPSSPGTSSAAPRVDPSPRAAPAAKKNDPAEHRPDPLPSPSAPDHPPGGASAADTPLAIWQKAMHKLADATAEMAAHPRQIDRTPDGRLVVRLAEAVHRFCNRPAPKSRIEQALAEVSGQPLRVEFVMERGESAAADPPPAPVSKMRQMRESVRDPLVKATIDLFDADVVDVTQARPRGGSSSPSD